MINHIKILGLGHPRTGTGFTAKVLTQWGLPMGHEVFREYGSVNWALVNETGPYPFRAYGWTATQKKRPEYDHLVYNVRDPFFSIPSLAYTENDPSKEAFIYRRLKMGIPLDGNPIENAIQSILAFDQMILNLNPDIVFRIEDQQKRLFEYFVSHYDIEYVKIRERANVRDHNNMASLLNVYGTPSKEFCDQIDSFCERHGYRNIFN